MKYACLIYGDGNLDDPLPAAEMDALHAESREYHQALQRSGHFIVAPALAPASSATTVRNRAGSLSMTDGAFAESNEQLSGFLLIEARDLNEAIRIAAGHPAALGHNRDTAGARAAVA